MLLTTIPMSHPTFAAARWHDARWQHRQVMSLYGDLGGSPQARANGQILFRLEPDIPTTTGPGRVLIQSNTPPATPGLRTTDLTPVFNRYTVGNTVQLLLTANTVRTINRTTKDGTVRTHRARVPDSQLDGWLKDHLADCIDLQDPIQVTPSERRQGKAQLIMTTFRATGTITSPDRLRTHAIDGIGRAKSYGCGLLTALPPR